MNQAITQTSSQDYLIEMTFAPFGTLLTPEEVVTFTERFVLPTLESCQRLFAAGRILAGGPTLAATGFSFIARASSAAELEETIGALPLWPRAQTRVVPLGTFDLRAANIRQRLNLLKTRIQPAVVSPQSN